MPDHPAAAGLGRAFLLQPDVIFEFQVENQATIYFPQGFVA